MALPEIPDRDIVGNFSTGKLFVIVLSGTQLLALRPWIAISSAIHCDMHLQTILVVVALMLTGTPISSAFGPGGQ